MKCDMCGDPNPIVHITEVINDKTTKLHLCEECAKTKSEEMQSHFGLNDLLSGLMDFSASDLKGEIEKEVKLKCGGCGMSYLEFQNSGKLGCGKCYSAFNNELSDLLRKIHGSERHIGKMPFKGESTRKEQKDLKRLRNELAELIIKEEFEKAAVLRDRIKDLEKQVG